MISLSSDVRPVLKATVLFPCIIPVVKDNTSVVEVEDVKSLMLFRNTDKWKF